jgi:photosystem II stability/assembly factor-like uncharacterized protein
LSDRGPTGAIQRLVPPADADEAACGAGARACDPTHGWASRTAAHTDTLAGMGWRRIVLAAVMIAGVVRVASANGRPPASSSITFRHGHENEIAAGLTFGLVFSHDGGQTWSWMCESAIGYTGIYDPQYAYSSSGALFATTFDGLKVARDGCTFNPTLSGLTFTSTSTFGPDGTFYYAAAQTLDTAKQLAADFKIYRSSDDGLTFPVSAKPGDPKDTNDWWQTLRVAPSDPMRVYVTGYSYMAATPGGEQVRTQLLFRSADGGTTWLPMTASGLTPMTSKSVVELVGIANDDPAHLYARVKDVDLTSGEAIYVSTNAGDSWTQINRKSGPISGFVVRAALNSGHKHDLIVGTQVFGAEISHDDGLTWTALVDPPHIGCLVENTAGEIWACTQNYGNPQSPSDNAGLMKTTDLTTWTKVLRYQDLTEAVTCGAGTLQHDSCAAMWCAVCDQLGCAPSASYNCPVPAEAPPVVTPKRGGGCCDAGATGGTGALALALVVGTLVRRPRRRRVTR